MSTTRIGFGILALFASAMAMCVPAAAQPPSILFIPRDDIRLVRQAIYLPPPQIPGFRRVHCCHPWRCCGFRWVRIYPAPWFGP